MDTRPDRTNTLNIARRLRLEHTETHDLGCLQPNHSLPKSADVLYLPPACEELSYKA